MRATRLDPSTLPPAGRPVAWNTINDDFRRREVGVEKLPRLATAKWFEGSMIDDRPLRAKLAVTRQQASQDPHTPSQSPTKAPYQAEAVEGAHPSPMPLPTFHRPAQIPLAFTSPPTPSTPSPELPRARGASPTTPPQTSPSPHRRPGTLPPAVARAAAGPLSPRYNWATSTNTVPYPQGDDAALRPAQPRVEIASRTLNVSDIPGCTSKSRHYARRGSPTRVLDVSDIQGASPKPRTRSIHAPRDEFDPAALKTWCYGDTGNFVRTSRAQPTNPVEPTYHYDPPTQQFWDDVEQHRRGRKTGFRGWRDPMVEKHIDRGLTIINRVSYLGKGHVHNTQQPKRKYGDFGLSKTVKLRQRRATEAAPAQQG